MLQDKVIINQNRDIFNISADYFLAAPGGDGGEGPFSIDMDILAEID